MAFRTLGGAWTARRRASQRACRLSAAHLGAHGARQVSGAARRHRSIIQVAYLDKPRVVFSLVSASWPASGGWAIAHQGGRISASVGPRYWPQASTTRGGGGRIISRKYRAYGRRRAAGPRRRQPTQDVGLDNGASWRQQTGTGGQHQYQLDSQLRDFTSVRARNGSGAPKLDRAENCLRRRAYIPRHQPGGGRLA